MLSPEDRAEALSQFTPEELQILAYEWDLFWARPKQVEPEGNWFVWLIMAGRNFGKTRTGAEWVRKRVKQGARRIILIGRTAADVRDVMIMGESGLLNIGPPEERPKYEPSKRSLTWPNGATALTFSADKPDQLRGPQGDTCWADEIGAWRYSDAWNQMRLGLRSPQSGLQPRVCATTTPRPTDLVRSLVKDSSVHVTRGSTYENKSNTAPSFLSDIERLYAGTRLGRQELDGELLEDAPGALWNLNMIDSNRIDRGRYEKEEYYRIVVAVDPAVTSKEGSDETGIVVAGLREKHLGNGKYTRHVDILDDKSGIYSPNEWAKHVASLWHRWQADCVVTEVNNGGDLVEANILNTNRSIRVVKVRASRGKAVRAEPAVGLYEQGRVHHVGYFAELEDQMVSWDPAISERSPDRVDALVWALWELVIKDARGEFQGTDPSPKDLEKHRAEEALAALKEIPTIGEEEW